MLTPEDFPDLEISEALPWDGCPYHGWKDITFEAHDVSVWTVRRKGDAIHATHNEWVDGYPQAALPFAIRCYGIDVAYTLDEVEEREYCNRAWVRGPVEEGAIEWE